MSQATDQNITTLADALTVGDTDAVLDAIGVSRRGVLATLAGGLAAASGASAATASTQEADPVFEAINAFREARAAVKGAGAGVTDVLHPPADLEEAYHDAMDAELDAYEDLVDTVPTTAAGRDAWLDALLEDGVLGREHFDTILENVRASLAGV